MTPGAIAVDTPVIDQPSLLERVCDDRELLAGLVEVFLLDLPVRLAAVDEAVNIRDAEEVRKAGHALRGAAGNLSAMRLSDAARTLELMGAGKQLEGIEDVRRLVSAEAAAVVEALLDLQLATAGQPAVA